MKTYSEMEGFYFEPYMNVLHLWIVYRGDKNKIPSNLIHTVEATDYVPIDQREWFKENIKHYFTHYRHDHSRKRTWYFEDEQEALLFKLRFG